MGLELMKKGDNMKYNDAGFRITYNSFVVYDLNDRIKSLMINEINEGNCVLMYAFVNASMGLCLKVIAPGVHHGENFRFFDVFDNNEILRLEDLKDEEMFFIADNEHLKEKHADIIALNDETSDDLKKARSFAFLDEFRDPFYPDNISVRYIRKGYNDEVIQTQLIGLEEHSFIGRLLKDPIQDFKYYEGDIVAFFLRDLEKGEIECYCDLTPDCILRPGDLEDGQLLKEAINVFEDNPCERNLFELMQILRDSELWIPCHVLLDGEENEEGIASFLDAEYPNMLVIDNELVDGHREIEIYPDVLESDDDTYLAAFTSLDDVDDDCKKRYMIHKDILKILDVIEHFEIEVKGLVVNPQYEAWIFPKNLFNLLRMMKSRIMYD